MTNNKPLVFTHRAKDEKQPILTFWFPEPMPESAVTVSRSSDDGIGWQRQCLEATGIGRYLSYRTYDLHEAVSLFALGEKISITPVQNNSEAAAPPNKPVSYKPRPEEQTMLDNLKNRDKSTLLAEFYELFNTVNKKQQQKEKEIELNTMVKEQAAKLWGDEKALLAGLYFGSAKYLAMYHDDKKNTSEDRLLLKKAVVKACDLSFALEKPHVVALAFYMKWKIEGQPTFQPLDSQQLKELLTTMLPHKIMQFTSDTSRRGKNLFMEQFKEATGFTSSFSDMRTSRGDKPKEIVELHKKLTEHCIETVELNLSDGITRSDILREIDSAYELNDFVSLLQIEIEQLCIRHRYVKQQDEERLKWFIIALRYLEKEYDHFFVQLKTDPVYEDLHLYHTLDDSLRKFKAEIRQKLDRSRIKGFELSAELKKVVSGQNTEQTLKFAAFMLKHEGV